MTRRYRCFGFLLGFIFSSVFSSAQTSNFSLTKDAIAHFNNGQINEALEKWMTLYAEGNRDPNLMYNIGLAHSLLDKRGDALLFFEKAKRFKPANNDLLQAIQNERNKIPEAVTPINPFFISKWVSNFLSILRPAHWAFVGILFLLIALTRWFFELDLVRRLTLLRSVNKFLLAGAGVLFLFVAILAYQRIYRANEAIIFSSCETRQGPSVQSPLVRILHEGEKVKIKDEIGGWYRVNFLNLDEAWLKKDCIRLINVEE